MTQTKAIVIDGVLGWKLNDEKTHVLVGLACAFKPNASFISTKDLRHRFEALGLILVRLSLFWFWLWFANRETLYGGSGQGYTDYPMLRAVAPHACYHDAERAWE
jgi:hypothetical protein